MKKLIETAKTVRSTTPISDKIFWDGFSRGREAGRKDGLTCGIGYCIGLLNRYWPDLKMAEFLINESGLKSKKELRDAGCEEYDINNIGDLLPENRKHK